MFVRNFIQRFMSYRGYRGNITVRRYRADSNNNTNANVYGAVITAMPLREFSQLMW